MQSFQAARAGDVVMTPRNVQATVVEVTGGGRYDKVAVVENTVERHTSTWAQRNLLIQRRASSKELRQAAEAAEHGAEYDAAEVRRWSYARQAENSRRIYEARHLHALADAAEREGR